MSFEPPKPAAKLTPNEKDEFLAAYLAYYADAAKTNPTELRRKIPRSVFQPLLDQIGEVVAGMAKEIADKNVPSEHGKKVRQFLVENPIPGEIGKHLTSEMRAYAVLIRALHQWVVSQSLAIDRWIIAGDARKTLRLSSPKCIVTGDSFGQNTIELHHPMRDGRPPLPVSRKGHQVADDVFAPEDELGKALVSTRRKCRRSWRLIWQGCLVELGEPVDFSEYGRNREKSAGTAARWFARETKLSFSEIKAWIDENELLEPIN
jgi:hypothetical protein